MYTIKHAAQVTGLTAATLRAWERRYAIVAPVRTESGYRLYDEQSVRLLSAMNALVQEGWSPREAAQEARRITPAQAPAVPPPPPVGGDGLVGAASRLDTRQLSAVLDEQFSRASFENVVDGWLMPGLVSLGNAWADGEVSVAGEHLASNAVMRRLAAAFDASSLAVTGPRIVVGLPPGVRHELGALAFAVASRRAGLQAAYVGADLPAADWVAAVTDPPARAAVLAVLQDSDLPALVSVVDGLRSAAPGLVIAVGGALQAQAPPECLRLGHDIGAAAALLAARLAVPNAAQ